MSNRIPLVKYTIEFTVPGYLTDMDLENIYDKLSDLCLMTDIETLIAIKLESKEFEDITVEITD